MKKIIVVLFIVSISIGYSSVLSQTYSGLTEDSIKSIPIHYRRGVEIPQGYQGYQQYYTGKNLVEEKRSKFPLESTGVWTELNPKIPRVTYLGVHFVNKDTGWACGDLGALIKTTNGGQNWTISQTNTTTPILRVHSYNGRIVIATGYNGIILRSVDGGENFSQVISGSTRDLWSVKMLNDSVGFVCGLNKTLLKTTNAGITWQPIDAGLNGHYWELDFIGESFGMIVCSLGKILKTTDGGKNWTVQQAGDSLALFSITIIDSLHMAAAGLGGKNVYSSDGGLNWIQNSNLQHDELNSIRYVNTDTGYTIGTYGSDSWGIRKTTNRGVNWFDPPVQNLSEWELDLLEDEVGYSVGSNLWINKTTGGYDNWNGLFFNAKLINVFFTDELTGYAVDGTWTGGPLYKTTNGGNTWFGLPNFPTNVFESTLSCVTFTDSLTGFAGSAPSRIVKTTDAGNSWYIVNRTGLEDTVGLINKFFYINPTTGWAVTTRGGILKTTDSGENWFAQLNAGISIIFQSISFVDSLLGWTACINSKPFKTTDGGSNWIRQTNLDIWSRDVFFINNNYGWIVDETSWRVLKKTSNGGQNWSTVTEIVNPWKFHSFPDKQHWMISGATKKYITEDGGISWIDITSDVPASFNAFNAITNKLGYAVGELGLVLKYDDTTYTPVELIAFNNEIENNNVVLSWQTATETNNAGFEIERNTPLIPLSRGEAEGRGVWKSIGFLCGNGTTTTPQSYSFVDENLQTGKYQYRLKQIDYDGSFKYSDIIEVEIGTPSEFKLFQNYPNPFSAKGGSASGGNSVTTIKYDIPDVGTGLALSAVTLKVYDILGREVATLVNEEKQPGTYQVTFDASTLASGVYIYKLQAGNFVSSNKMILIK